MRRGSSGTSWRKTCGRSTPHPAWRLPERPSKNSSRSGASPTRPSPGYGERRGRSSPPFLAYDVEIQRVLVSTNAIESLNTRYRRAVGARGHFPTEQAALNCLYLVTRGLDPKGTGQAPWTTRWKPALNAVAGTFADRMTAAENL